MQLARQSKFLLRNFREENGILAFSFFMVICNLTGQSEQRDAESAAAGRDVENEIQM